MNLTSRFLRGLALAFIFSAITLGAYAQDEPKIPVISSIETDRILDHASQTVTVTGKVVRVGKSGDGGITFLNFSTNRGGFVAVVFRANYSSFPDGPEAFLNKEVHVTGEVKPYRGSIPQIQIQTPDQVKVIEEVVAS